MKLFLIDAIGPFFRGYNRKNINWSKIPFDHLVTEGPERQHQYQQIRQDMNEFALRVCAAGYNAVTLDDLAHLADHVWYEDQVRIRIGVYREEFRKIFSIVREHGLQLYMTMDMMSFTPELKKRLGGSFPKQLSFLAELIDGFFQDFAEVDGLIVRIGESDGLDISGDFKSELTLKTPKMLNRFLQEILPVFERHNRQLILRTWTVGAHPIGDFIWHRDTFQAVLKNIDSPALVLSMKYGESDFFRYLPLNGNFFRTSIPKIIELQARREYEGCGEYPSFCCWDYEKYARELKQAPNVLGISVWCQTGGWVPFRRLAYVGEGSIWTEFNSAVTLRIFRYGESVEQALLATVGEEQHTAYLEFFRLSDEVIKELLYTEEYARQKLFFRRVRIPPLIGVYWNKIFINPSMRKLLRYFVRDHEACVRSGNGALTKIKKMKSLAEQLNLPIEDIVYMKRTFKILVLARQYFFGPCDDTVYKRLKKAKSKYKKAYPEGSRYRYTIKTDLKPFRFNSRFLHWGLGLILRRQRGYRLIDQVFTIHLLALIYRVIRATRSQWIPKFARKSAMGIDAIFR